MAGIYIHIPFCRQACSYCNFHFTTSVRAKNELLAALLSELTLRKYYLPGEKVGTIYFGGGTPSILPLTDLQSLLKKIRSEFEVSDEAEITLEANPDDVSLENLAGWKDAGINRMSLGVQSFFDEDLQWMNRAHNSGQAIRSVELATSIFDNITIDLIYGTPLLTDEKWKQNVDRAVALNIPHLSCYALTVEQKTPLQKLIRKNKKDDINPDTQSEQYLLLMQWMNEHGYEHYEISNFAKPGLRSRHNSSYWQGKNYIGIGPSAHSFNGSSRQWNISNNNKYIQSIQRALIPSENEVLTSVQKLNEYIMTSLRTMEGLHLTNVDEDAARVLQTTAKKFIARGLMKEENECLMLTNEGRLMADGIAAELFFDEP